MDYQNQNPYSQQPQNSGAYDWDSTIQQESSFVLLKGGDYRFTIEKFDRARHNGSTKIPPCPKAVVTFRVYDDNGSSTLISENYFLCESMEWKLSEFFASIGMKKKGEPVRMQWTPELIGKSGVCEVYIDHYKGNDGSDKQSNKIKRLYPSYDQPVLAPPQQPQYAPPAQAYAQQPPMQQPQPQYAPPAGNWQSGRF
ncbi:MAG: DUF669 domain-containing protein [Oscillospiraceae bacterium]|nr:DUF669 domain-containing protein [Oscillospiraceae bacterium]